MVEPNLPSQGALLPDRGGVWELPYTAAEKVMLNEQAKFDRRYLYPIWYWRQLRVEDAQGGAPEEVLSEVARVHRRYAKPIPVHLYVDDTGKVKKLNRGVIETTDLAKIGFSRAEARRLGQLLKAADDTEGLTFDEQRKEPLFVARPEDVFLFRERYYEIVQLVPEYWGQGNLRATWKGTANLFRDDSTAPGPLTLPKPPTVVPPRPEEVPWLR